MVQDTTEGLSNPSVERQNVPELSHGGWLSSHVPTQNSEPHATEPRLMDAVAPEV